MTLNEIDSYLDVSRSYIENSKRRLASMGFCCPELYLGKLIGRQNYLERIAWTERRNLSMGFLPVVWLAISAGTIATAIGAWVYSHFTQTKIQSDYLDCLEREEAKGNTSEAAKNICSGGGGVSEEITKTIKLAVYGAIAVMVLYVVSKFIKEKKR